MAGSALAPAFLGLLLKGGRLEAWVVSGLLAAWIIRRAAAKPAAVKLLVRDGVAGIILLDASMVMSCGLLVPGLAVAALLVPAALGVWGFKKLA
jgi:hypothetical protein